MKVIGPGMVGASQSTARKNTRKVGDGSFHSLISGDEEEVPTLEPSSSIRATGLIGSLLAMQEMESPTEKPIKRGKNILQELDKIRVGLLQGGISEGTMQNLRREIASNREQVADPKLQDILDEIDVRAAVELAKLEKSGKTSA